MLEVPRLGHVPEPVAVRADDHAFLGLRERLLPSALETAKTERLVASLSVVELEGSNTRLVPAVLASRAEERQQPFLEPMATLATIDAIRLRRRATTDDSMGSAMGVLEVLCAPKGEHERQKRRR